MYLSDLTWPVVARLPREIPVVFPIAALEQHGHHLPLLTDSMILGEIVRRIADHFVDRVAFAPLLWLGNSDHHLDFSGTLSAPPRTYLDLLNQLAENMLGLGFHRIVFLNGHGGNDVPAKQALFELRQRRRQETKLLLLLATYWNLGAKPWRVDPSFQQREMGHACEWETSMILRLAPHLVGDYHHADDVPLDPGFAPGSRAWTTKDRSSSGHLGAPRHATAEKGETLLRIFSEDVAGFLDRVIAWNGISWDG